MVEKTEKPNIPEGAVLDKDGKHFRRKDEKYGGKAVPSKTE